MNKHFLWCIFAFVNMYAQEKDSLTTNYLKEVIISSTKFNVEKEKSTQQITVISKEELENKKGQSILQVLNAVAGIEINGSQSVVGKNIGLYMRGGRNRQVAIYINGVPMNDASAINSSYDLRLLDVNQIEKIEIIKDAASVLYGSGAATGVINIVLKKQNHNTANAYFYIGTQTSAQESKINPNYFNQGFSINTKTKKFSFFTSLNSIETKGLSEIKGIDNEADKFSNLNLMQKITYNSLKNFNVDVITFYDKLKNNFDNTYSGEGYIADNNINNGLTEQFRIAISPKYSYNKGEVFINAMLSKSNRFLTLYNDWILAQENYNYNARSANVDLVNKYKVNNKWYVVSGFQYQYFDMSQADNYTNINPKQAKYIIADVYASSVFSFEKLNIQAGLRYNSHSNYSNNWLSNLNLSYSINNFIKCFAAYNKAYIAPSLYQQYSSFGNTNLHPEKNQSISIGAESTFLSNKLKLNLTAYYREENQSIDFFFNSNTFQSYYINVDELVTARGIETQASYAITSKINFSTNYTYTQVLSNYNRLIPKNKLNANLIYNYSKGYISLNSLYVSSRADAFYDATLYTTTQTKLREYYTVSAHFSHKILNNGFQLIWQVNNIFNKDFEEVSGYNALGRNFKLGLLFSF